MSLLKGAFLCRTQVVLDAKMSEVAETAPILLPWPRAVGTLHMLCTGLSNIPLQSQGLIPWRWQGHELCFTSSRYSPKAFSKNGCDQTLWYPAKTRKVELVLTVSSLTIESLHFLPSNGWKEKPTLIEYRIYNIFFSIRRGLMPVCYWCSAKCGRRYRSCICV